MKEDELVAEAQAALARTGAAETVVAAGIFHPRDFHSAGLLGGLSGAAVGGMVGDVLGGDLGESVGMAVGVPAGMAQAGKASGQPRFTVMAVTATTIYGFLGERAGGGQVTVGDVLWSVERAHASMTVHSRISMRVVEIEDLRTGGRLAFEAERIGGYQTKFVIAALHDLEGADQVS